MRAPPQLQAVLLAAHDACVWVKNCVKTLVSGVCSLFAAPLSTSAAVVPVSPTPHAKEEKTTTKKQKSKATKSHSVFEMMRRNLRIYLARARVQCATVLGRRTPSWRLTKATASFSLPRPLTPLVLAMVMRLRWVSIDWIRVFGSLGSLDPLSSNATTTSALALLQQKATTTTTTCHTHLRLCMRLWMPSPMPSFVPLVAGMALRTRLISSVGFVGSVTSVGSLGPLSVLPLAPARGAPTAATTTRADSQLLTLLTKMKRKTTSKKKTQETVTATASVTESVSCPRLLTAPIASTFLHLGRTFVTSVGSLGPLRSVLPSLLAAPRATAATTKSAAPAAPHARPSPSLVWSMQAPRA